MSSANKTTLSLCLPALLAFSYSLFAPSLGLTPQIIALLSIALTIYTYLRKNLSVPLLIAIVSILVFTTSGIVSPFFPFVDLVLILVAFLYHPAQSLLFSSFLVLLLANTFDFTLNSFINFFSLLLIAPHAWLIAKLQKKYQNNLHQLVQEETDMELWLHLDFKKRILKNLELIDSLPKGKERETLEQNHHFFLNSVKKLSKEISEDTKL